MSDKLKLMEIYQDESLSKGDACTMAYNLGIDSMSNRLEIAHQQIEFLMKREKAIFDALAKQEITKPIVFCASCSKKLEIEIESESGE